MKRKKQLIVLITIIFATLCHVETKACSRIVYLGPDNMVITGRTMDWEKDIKSSIYVLPRGMKRASHNQGNPIEWTSKYGSVVASAFEMSTSDGMNEKGLVVSMLYLIESNFVRPNDTRPMMGIAIWPQYVLDNFATVSEAVKELKKETFRIDAPHLPDGAPTTIHLAISDATGNSAILEYIDGNLIIHEGKQYQILTNSPTYDDQLAINEYWKKKNGLSMLPGTNNSSDRFVRGSFYVNAIPQTSDPKLAVPAVLSVIRNMSVPLGISTPNEPNISSTRWRSISDQKNRVYYFETTLTPNLFWLDLKELDFNPKAKPLKLSLTNGESYTGNVQKDLKDGTLTFLFQLPK